MGRLIAIAILVFALAAPPAAQATTLPESFKAACPTYGDQQICSGDVQSFDGSKLDVDLTLPHRDTGTSHPLIVMLHGFGNDKREWESLDDEADGADKAQWNSHWFARHGYYVLTYTARGFRDDGPSAAYEPPTPSDPTGSVDVPNGTIHIKSRDYEIRDTQWLAALTAATFPDLDRTRIAVTGGSYGGGESWMQAAQARWSFPHEQDPTLPVLDLQVAIPKYPWTDLAYALAPNGHGGGPSRRDLYESSQAIQSSDEGGGTPATGNPLGAPKESYIAGLYGLGTEKGVFDEGTDVPPPENENGPENITAWNTRIAGTGDPYPDGDPVLQQAARGLTELRSAYYQDELWPRQPADREVAVFSIQGWTDDLFEAVESFRMFKYLKRLDPLWPVGVAVADVGHSRAQNRPATWRRLNNQAWQFLQSNITGSHRQQTTVTSEPTVCTRANTPTQELTATTPEGLSAGTLDVAFDRPGSLTSESGLLDPNGPATEPVVGGTIEPGERCRTSDGPAVGGYTAVSQPLGNTRTYVGLGWVEVPYTFEGETGQLDARVWDVAPDGTTLLMTRGTYRFSVPTYDQPTGTIRL